MTGKWSSTRKTFSACFCENFKSIEAGGKYFYCIFSKLTKRSSLKKCWTKSLKWKMRKKSSKINMFKPKKNLKKYFSQHTFPLRNLSNFSTASSGESLTVRASTSWIFEKTKRSIPASVARASALKKITKEWCLSRMSRMYRTSIASRARRLWWIPTQKRSSTSQKKLNMKWQSDGIPCAKPPTRSRSLRWPKKPVENKIEKYWWLELNCQVSKNKVNFFHSQYNTTFSMSWYLDHRASQKTKTRKENLKNPESWVVFKASQSKFYCFFTAAEVTVNNDDFFQKKP